MGMYSLKQLVLKISLFASFVCLLAACTSSPSNTVNSLNITPTAQNQTSLTPTPGIGLGPQSCPAAVSTPSHWDTLIPTQANVTKVANVTCGYLKGMPTLQALVTVLHEGTGDILDVYVYDHLESAAPTRIFTLLNLYKGDAKISTYNTVLTAEVDMASSANKQKPNAELSQDLDREFKWSEGASTLVQITFPGFFPDLTRYQAEADQQQVNQGHQPWKLSPTLTAQAFGASLLKWNFNADATILNGGGLRDAQAVVSLKNSTRVSNTIKLTMERLEGNTNGGIWIVIAVTSDNVSLTQPQTASFLNTPATVTGTGTAFEGVIGNVTVLDHLYTPIGRAPARGATGNGHTTFATSVSYQSTFKGGAEEGLVMLTTINNANGNIGEVALVKVLLQ